MKKISENKKLKVLYYYDVGIPNIASAITLKISETAVKNILIENNRTGSPPRFTQAYNTWLYLNQQFGEPIMIHPSKEDLQQEQQQKEKNNAEEVRITQLTDDLQKAHDREQNQKQESEKKSQVIEDLIERYTALTDERDIEKQKNERLQDMFNEKNEYIIKLERELGEEKTKVIKSELENKTMQKEYHDELEKIYNEVTNLIVTLRDLREMNNTLTEEKTRLNQENQEMKEKEKNSWKKYLLAGRLGATAGITSVLCYQMLSGPTSNSPVTPSVISGKNNGYDAIPNLKKDMIQPGIYGLGGGIAFPSTHLKGFGKGCGMVIPEALRNYIRQKHNSESINHEQPFK